MKKSVALFLTLAMLATLFCGIVPVSAATAQVVSGGEYADTDHTANISFVDKTKDYATFTADNSGKTITVKIDTTNATNVNNNQYDEGTIDLSEISWKYTGKIEITYDTTLISKADEMELKAGFVGKVYNNKWPTSNTDGNKNDDMISTVFFSKEAAANTTISSKMVYDFKSTGLVIDIYTKQADGSYILTKSLEGTTEGTNASLSKLFPYVQAKTAKGAAEIKYSNVKIREIVNEAKLQTFSETLSPTDTLDISINLPDNYSAAKLTIGGTEFFSGTPSQYAPGAYKVTADLAELTWCGNMDIVFDITKADGTTETLTSPIKVIKGPDKTRTQTEDFEDEDMVFDINTSGTSPLTYTDTSSTTGRTGKVAGFSETEKANNPSEVLIYSYDSNSYPDATMCIDMDFDMWFDNGSVGLGVWITGINKEISGETVTEATKIFKAGTYVGYGASVIATQNDSSYNGSWHKVRFTVDIGENKVYVYVDGDLKGSGNIEIMKGTSANLKEIRKIGLNVGLSNWKDERKLYIDNLQMSTYVKGDKPAIDGISVGEGNAISVKFDKAVTVGENAITLKCGGSNIASSVAYDEATLTATITPSESLTALNGTVEIADSVAGYAMSVPVEFSADMPFITNAKLEKQSGGEYVGTVDVYNDKAEELGAVYVAVYDGTALAGVAKAVINSIDGKTTITCPFTPSDASSASAAYTAKMFVWDNALKPILNVVE